jgi:cytoskeletal protein RodZ
MQDETVASLRGYDSYVVRLGDELRGERASKGKSLLDVQRELKVKAAYVDAIENCDATVFPNPGFVAGYVRAYARYLGLDADEIYRRFCAESGFQGVNGRLAAGGGRRRAPFMPPGPPRQTLSSARFSRAAPTGLSLRQLSGLGSVLVLALLVAGLGYGGWYLLRDIQRLGLVPVAEAPDAIADSTLVAPRATAPLAVPEPPVIAAAPALPALEPPKFTPRDGPIRAIDPDRYGLFLPVPSAALPDAVTAAVDTLAVDEPTLATDPAAEATPALPQGGVAVTVRDSAWVRIYLADGSVVFENIMKPGETYELAGDLASPLLRAGNAGAVYLRVGADLYGPLGNGANVIKQVPLDPEAIAASWPRAAPAEAIPAAVTPVPAPRSAALPPAR